MARHRIRNVAKPNRQGTQLVVIGSSAGGIEALSRVVAGLPTDFGAPIIVAQHLDPRRPSHLGEILHRHSTLPVRTAEHGERLEDGVIFVIPSNRLVDIVDHTIVLRPAEIGSIAPSVDRVLETAARAYGPGLIAVILTGSGSDGSAGAWHVKAAGGLIVIEDPATAKFPSMPRSISPLLVDATADLESMGEALAEMLATDGHAPSGGEAREFSALLDWVHRNGGADFSTYKPATILRRLRGRMIANGDASIDAYRRRLEADPEEYARLLSSLLIKVTEFFRDPAVFAHLRDKVLPRARRGRSADGTATPTVVGGLRDRRRSLFAGDQRDRGDARWWRRLGSARVRDGHRPRRGRLRAPRPLPRDGHPEPARQHP